MRFFAAVMALACAWALWAEPRESQEMQRAAAQAERIRTLVEAGVLPRASLDQAEEELADAQDGRILDRTLYGSLGIEDLTEEQADEMVAAATRRLERQRTRLESAKKLVEEGALPRLSLTPLIEEEDRSRRTLELAVSRAGLLRELAALARAEQAPPAAAENPLPGGDLAPLAERYSGGGPFRPAVLDQIAHAFEKEFARPLPVSARGQTAVHRSLGFDHGGRLDVAVNPDHPEGQWLRAFLRSMRIPFFAFRGFVPGKSTGPHIHIGPPSEPLRSGG
jgi:hypothetical protein